MRAKACTCGGRVGLYGVAFVPKIFRAIIQQPPNTFNVFVVVGNVRVVHVHPVSHLFGERLPLVGIFHDLAAAGFVVIFNRYVARTVFVADVFFGNTKRFFNRQFNRQTMGIPTGFAFYLKAL